MRNLKRSVMAIVILMAGMLPAFFLAVPEAGAFCSLLGDGYAADGITRVVSYECESEAECTEWSATMSDGLSSNVKWELYCSVAEAPPMPSNPLGEPPSLIPSPPVQVTQLDPACYAESCEGLDPEGTRCLVDARTIYSEEVIINSEWSTIKGSGPWGIAEMRYSPTCHANWVRYTPYTNIDDVIRFVLNAGVQQVNDGNGFGTYYGVPYIWRLGVEGTLYGPTGSSDPVAIQVTNWTSMVSADGQTCWSVEIHWRADHHAGAGERDHLGTFDAKCVS